MSDTNDLFGASPAPPPPNLVKLLNEWRGACPAEIEFAAPGMFWLLVPRTGDVLVKADRPATTDLWHIEGHARACIERAGYDVETHSQYHLGALWPHYWCRGILGIGESIRLTNPQDAPVLAVALVTLRLLVHANTNPDA